MLVLLVDDDTQYAEMSAEALRSDSHQVIIANSIHAANRVLETGGPTCAVLDKMEDGGGLEFARSLRARGLDLPIVFIARTPSDRDLIAAYGAGADDFLTKPFNPRELILRVRAVTRRCQCEPVARRQAPVATVAHDDAVAWDSSDERPLSRRPALSFVDGSVHLDGRDLNCTPLEADILRALAWVPGQVLTYELLNERVWGYPEGPGGALLKGHVSSLRRKLKEAGGLECLIRTVRGVGYAYAE